MKTRLLNLFTAAAVLLAGSLTAHSENITDEMLIEAFRQSPYRAAAGHAPYEAPSSTTCSCAPKGYKAFYISHFGRHGSRFQGDEGVFSRVCQVLDKMHSENLLTPSGDSLRVELQQMWDSHKEQRYGMLTQRGAKEHQGIAERMFWRNPEVFMQKGRNEVGCRSTVVARCVESMANFAITLKEFNPILDITMQTDLLTGRTAGAPDHKKIRAISGPVEEALLAQAGTMPTLAARLFTDPDAAAALTPKGEMGRFLFNMFKAAAGAGCLDEKFDPLRFFTPEELLACNKIRNIHFSSSYGCFGPTRDIAVGHSHPYAKLLIQEADEAIAGNGRCADLRFAHDKQLGPMLSLLDLENYNVYTPTYESHNYLAAWKYLSMAVNVQIVFYRNKQNDILVKFLSNERETAVPSLEAVEGVYYRWSDVREHILNRINRK